MRRRYFAVAAAGLVALAGPAAIPHAPAQQAKPALSIAPAIQQISTLPGRTAEETITVVNLSQEDLRLTATLEDLQMDSRGRVSSGPSGASQTSAAPWGFVEPPSFLLPGGHSQQVQVSVTPPAGTSSGGYEAAVRLVGERNSGGVISSLHALLVEVRSGGRIDRAARLVGITMPARTFGSSVPVTLQLRNTGTAHVVATGTIIVRDAFSRTTARVSIPRIAVLRGRTRFVTVQVPSAIVPWKMTVEADIGFGPGIPRGSATTDGIATPYWSLAVAALVLLLLLRVLFGLIRRVLRRRAASQHADVTMPEGVAVRKTAPATSEPIEAGIPGAEEELQAWWSAEAAEAEPTLVERGAASSVGAKFAELEPSEPAPASRPIPLPLGDGEEDDREPAPILITREPEAQIPDRRPLPLFIDEELELEEEPEPEPEQEPEEEPAPEPERILVLVRDPEPALEPAAPELQVEEEPEEGQEPEPDRVIDLQSAWARPAKEEVVVAAPAVEPEPEPLPVVVTVPEPERPEIVVPAALAPAPVAASVLAPPAPERVAAPRAPLWQEYEIRTGEDERLERLQSGVRRAASQEPSRPLTPAAVLRRADAAMAMLAAGSGRSGERVDVALDLLRSIRTNPSVIGLVEGIYDATTRAGKRDALAPLALALGLVGSAKASEALLEAYAASPPTLEEPLRGALRKLDPSELRRHRKLMSALSKKQRESLELN